PFEADVTPYVIAGKSVRITVCVNNELNWQTIPPGMVITDENGKKKQSYFLIIDPHFAVMSDRIETQH
ncbi:sugar-binding domain-containing protein, partial [Escherichia sp. HC-CC]